jgi:hypothetical protein
VPNTPMNSVIAAFEKHLREIENWLSTKPDLRVLWVQHSEVLKHAEAEAFRIAEFVGLPLDTTNMARQVERSLHREKMGSSVAMG